MGFEVGVAVDAAGVEDFGHDTCPEPVELPLHLQPFCATHAL